MALTINLHKRIEAINFAIVVSLVVAAAFVWGVWPKLAARWPELASYREAYHIEFARLSDDKFWRALLGLLDKAQLDYILASWAVILVLFGWLFAKISHWYWGAVRLSDERQAVRLRGAQRLTAAELAKAVRKLLSRAERKRAIKLGEVALPPSQENRHTLIIGAPGSGKSVLLKSWMSQLIERQEREEGRRDERLIIFDRKPEFVQPFIRDQDLLLYPRSSESGWWDLGHEVKTDDDIHYLASNLVPVKPDEKQPIFPLAGQAILRAVLHHLQDAERLSNQELIDFLRQYSTADKMRKELSATARRHAIQIDHYLQGGDAFSASVLGTAYASLSKALMTRDFYTPNSSDRSFCINDYLDPDNAGRNLFVIQPAGNDSWTAYYALFFSFLSRRIRQLKNDTDRRLWVILDEFQSLHTPNNHGLYPLLSLAAEGRQKGAAMIFATQAMASVQRLYQKEGMASLLNTTSNKIFLQNQNPEEAKLITDIFHEQELKDYSISQSIGGDPRKMEQAQAIRSSIRMTKVVLPSELAELPIKKIKNGLEFTALAKIGDLPVGELRYRTADHPERYELADDEPRREFVELPEDAEPAASAGEGAGSEADDDGQSAGDGYNLY
jgi:hypothetical protein